MTRLRPFRPLAERLEGRDLPAVYFVSPSGSNANPGTDAQPWRTLQYAADHVLPGDSVQVRAGTYVGFVMWSGGTPNARIEFRADPGVTINTKNYWSSDGINLESAGYVTIDGFQVVWQNRAGIRAVENAGVVIRNNVCDNNNKWGIFTGFSEGVVIENNVTSRSWSQHGIYVSNSADDPVIRGNRVWGCYGSGIQLNADLGQGGDGIISNALIENNVIYNNGAGGGASINLDGVQGSVIRNNLVYGARGSGLVLYKYNGAAGSTNNLVENNTVLAASNGRWAAYVAGGSSGNTFRNNIFHSAHSARGALNISSDSLPGLVSNYNAVEDLITLDDGGQSLTLAQWRVQTGQDAASLVLANPAALFVDAAGGDYHLAAGAAVIDAGTTAGAPPADLWGVPRPTGPGVDIGHAEYLPPNSPPTVGPIDHQTIPTDGTAGPLAVTVGDAETPPASLTVTAASSNLALLPLSGIALGGSGADRTVTLTPAAGQWGLATVTLTVTDGGGLTATRSFNLTVTPPPGTGKPYAVGTDAGPVATVTSYNADGSVRFTARPFGNSYTGGVRVAVGDVTGDGVADVVAGSNGGMYAAVKVVDGVAGAVLATNLLGVNWSYSAVSVAVGDVTGDGVADVAAGTAETGPRVRVFRGGDYLQLSDFLAGPTANFWGRAEVALGDLTGDGTADLAVVGYYSTGNRVAGYTGTSLRVGVTPVAAFAPFTLSAAYGTGVFLAVGDVTGDGYADLVVGSGAWGDGKVRAYNGQHLVQSNTKTVVADFAPPNANGTKGVRVGSRDVDGDGRADFVTGSGAWLHVFTTASLPPTGLPPQFRQVNTGLAGGIFVG